MESSRYIHGYSDEEGERLLAQAEFLAPWVLDEVRLDGVTRLLEVGVGVGAETLLLRARWPALRVFGVDVSAASLARARQTLAADVEAGAVTLVRASGTALPLAARSVDGAFLCWVLEHVADPAHVVGEAARCLRPGAPAWLTEVYNRSLLVEPGGPALDDYWRALNDVQRAGGGHPDIGARLAELAGRAGLAVESLRFVPVLGDARDPARRRALLDYFESLLRSAAPAVVRAGAFAAARLDEVWAVFERARAAPDGLLCYTFAQLIARRR
jgi:SAM-dependent methyltransferase